jgi:chaperone BCS1
LNEVKGFVDRLCTEYLKKENDHRKNKKFIYTYDKEDTWNETEFLSTKTFDNLFFDGKEDIMKKIDFFLNNREWYEKNGIPYTLGIGLYGPPGTGKTSFIKALANYVGRHVVSLPLKLAKTKSALDKMYYEDTYSKATVPFDKKIIVMEDIDCVGKFVFQRKSTDESEVDSNVVHVLQKPQLMKYMNGNSETDSDGSDNKKFIVGTGTNGDERKPTLDDLLNLVDGIRENTGRILIITSNFYHKLDSALIRPGRIDITLKMDNASRQTIGQMYAQYYGEPIPESILDRIPDRAFSSAEVVNFYVEHRASKQAFLECLIKDHTVGP